MYTHTHSTSTLLSLNKRFTGAQDMVYQSLAREDTNTQDPNYFSKG